MSQHDFDIANDTSANVRADINNALQALASLSAAATPPTTTYAYQLWYDTDNHHIHIRNAANSAWYKLFRIDQTDGLQVFSGTGVVDTSTGVDVGTLTNYSSTDLITATITRGGLISPANLKTAIETHARDGVGYGTAQGVTFQNNIVYQNNGSAPDMIVAVADDNPSGVCTLEVYVGTSQTNPTKIAESSAYQGKTSITFIVPPQHYFKISGSPNGISTSYEVN